MPFAYFDKLSTRSKRTYRKSDAIARVEVPDVATLVPVAEAIAPALAAESVAAVQRTCQALVDALNARLGTPPVVVKVLERRPANSDYELQGLYEPDEVTGGRARITVWMRTAKKEQVVKFRTFLRTLLHEVCHHLDYELYQLAETFHTEGFYARESALMRELLGEAPTASRPGGERS
ncbi:MAG TPA: hypothetical protein VM051_08105 [Usitatibacter sp.]|nr:hypothetical protein [Usitatibacter sp.]